MLAATTEHDRADERYGRFLETGMQIARGKVQISAKKVIVSLSCCRYNYNSFEKDIN
jgi:hypothetical protein